MSYKTRFVKTIRAQALQPNSKKPAAGSHRDGLICVSTAGYALSLTPGVCA
jgi:hypothetical protein